MEKVSSRTGNALRNSFWGILCKIIQSVCPFAVRTVMIYELGSEYTGLSGLFSSILKVLSLAELGFSSAITYNMYAPIAHDDSERVCALLNAYRKIYRIVGGVVLAIGFILLPFLKYFIYGSYPQDINIYILYVLYLLNTCLTYFLFAYRTSLLNAYQRYDLISKISLVCSFLMYLLEILSLILTKNYYIYMSCMIITTALNNCLVLLQTKRLFPKIKCEGRLNQKEMLSIKMRVKALLGHRIGTAVITSADNIVISSFMGLVAVTCFNNYYMILAAIISIIDTALGGIVAPIGNFIELKSKDELLSLFKKLNFILQWGISWAAICFGCLIQDFIELWLGKAYLYTSTRTVFLFVLYFYSWKIRSVTVRFKEAAGMWNDDFWKPYVASLINVSLNILLVRIIGIDGVLLSTVYAMIFINFPWETHVLYKNLFQRTDQEKSYYAEVLKRSLVALLTGVATGFLCYSIQIKNIYWMFAVKLLICMIVPNAVFAFFSRNDKDYIDTIQMIRDRIKKMICKREINT